MADGVGDLEDSKLVVLAGAYLHEVGNAMHQDLHGRYLAKKVLDRMLRRVYVRDDAKKAMVEAEALHCLFAHDDEVEALNVEAGVVKVADSTDMAEGRAKIPYRTGKVDTDNRPACSRLRPCWVGR